MQMLFFMQAACLHLLIEVSSYDDCVFCCIMIVLYAEFKFLFLELMFQVYQVE